MLDNKNIVTIDGPSGVGKSTISRQVAKELGFTYLDTGAMYRGVGLHVKLTEIDPSDEIAIASAMRDLDLELKPATVENEDVGVVINGRDVSLEIRTPEVSMIASQVSALGVVREKLTEMQRSIGSKGKIVAEGRDTGTVVFPQAAFKFFLDATPEERARRRVDQLRRNGEEVNEEDILAMTIKRDRDDSSRSLAPLKKAMDAFCIDTTSLSIAEVKEQILGKVKDQLSRV